MRAISTCRCKRPRACASPLSSILGAGFDALKIKSINLEIEASERKRFLQVDQITASPKQVHPGGSVELSVTLTGENGLEVQKNVRYRVPVGAPAGVLSFTVSDGSMSNALDYQQMASEAAQKRHAAGLVPE